MTSHAAAPQETSVPRELLELVSHTARHLQPAHARRLAAAMATHNNPATAPSLAATVPAAAFAAAVRPLLQAWQHYPWVPGTVLGTAVAAAAQAHHDARGDNSMVEIVMSGPPSPTLHPRRTEQVLLQLIGEARNELILVTYSLTMYTELKTALAAATARGVHVTVLAEDPLDRPGFTGDPAHALLGLHTTRLRWPTGQRAVTWASLHAKLAIIDQTAALVTSANLSEAAANHNLEAGLLVRGGNIPLRLAQHVQHLRAAGTLVAA